MPINRILVVDDDRLTRQMVLDLLEGGDFVVTEAIDGTGSLARAAASQPDLILLDLMMPGMDGYTVCRNLKAGSTTKAIPVVFLTASTDPALNRTAFAAGAMACVTKPFRRDACWPWSMRRCTEWPVGVSAMEPKPGRPRRCGNPPARNLSSSSWASGWAGRAACPGCELGASELPPDGKALL